jgi:hypothetical protein
VLQLNPNIRRRHLTGYFQAKIHPSFAAEIVDEMQKFTTAYNELKSENEMLRETLAQIKWEAEQAQQSGFWDSLLQLIFSLIS